MGKRSQAYQTIGLSASVNTQAEELRMSILGRWGDEHDVSIQTPQIKVSSLERAKAAQRAERAQAVAALLANFEDINLRDASTAVRDHFLGVGFAALRLAARAPRGL